MIEYAKRVGASSFTEPYHISSGNPKINLLFTASIFNACPGLEEITEEEQKEISVFLDDDI